MESAAIALAGAENHSIFGDVVLHIFVFCFGVHGNASLHSPQVHDMSLLRDWYRHMFCSCHGIYNFVSVTMGGCSSTIDIQDLCFSKH